MILTLTFQQSNNILSSGTDKLQEWLRNDDLPPTWIVCLMDFITMSIENCLWNLSLSVSVHWRGTTANLFGQCRCIGVLIGVSRPAKFRCLFSLHSVRSKVKTLHSQISNVYISHSFLLISEHMPCKMDLDPALNPSKFLV